MEKVYHIPDWTRATKGSSLTSYALCGMNTDGPQTVHWFPYPPTKPTCPDCLKAPAKES